MQYRDSRLTYNYFIKHWYLLNLRCLLYIFTYNPVLKQPARNNIFKKIRCWDFSSWLYVRELCSKQTKKEWEIFCFSTVWFFISTNRLSRTVFGFSFQQTACLELYLVFHFNKPPVLKCIWFFISTNRLSRTNCLNNKEQLNTDDVIILVAVQISTVDHKQMMLQSPIHLFLLLSPKLQ